MDNPSNWITVAESRFPWERDALDFVRQRFPNHEPYRAWSNFEFIGEDGSINEVDLLVFTPMGFFLIEIKSRPGRLSGDAGTWTWETDGRLTTHDNPLLAANSKAKRLRSLLERRKAFQHNTRPPFIEPLIFCSAPDLQCDLTDIAHYRVCLRDRDPIGNSPAEKGIMAAIRSRECPGLDPVPKGTHDRAMLRQLTQALEQAGIRPSQRRHRVSDFLLGDLLEEGAGYQDREATHTQLPNLKRRVRLYPVRAAASEEDREKIRRAASREFQLLEKLQHPNILRSYAYTEHELGPAIILAHDPQAVRLDHYLAQKGASLSVDVQLDLIRQIAETIRFAHDKKVVHRALSPQSILVTGTNDDHPRVLIYNWQAGYSGSASASGSTGTGSGAGQLRPTTHIDRLVDDISTAYMAPEALADEANTGEHLDVFSLGAIAYHLFSGQAPAANGLELSDKLRETRGLRISSVMNGAPEFLQTLIQFSTHPDVASRFESVAEFLRYLDEVENELTTPEHEFAFDPARAQIGDLLPGGFTVVKRLGQGASAVALLVARDNQEYVLKAANDPDHNARIQDEAAVLPKLRHPCIVEHCETLQVGDRAAFLMRPVLVDRDKTERRVETLGQRLRQEGRLHIDMLQRFGEDLLEAVNHLEEQGIPHRDIKPDNIVLGYVGRGDRLHLVLFDFSLSRTAPDNLRAGTVGYLDPLLPLRKPPRWDLHAERYSTAVTLYEMATGALPTWGDGVTDPSHLDCEITLDTDLFDTGLRDSMTEFFKRAFRRDLTHRFDNAEVMLRAWRRCFEGIEQPGALSEVGGAEALRLVLAGARLETELSTLRLGTRAANALDRANLLTVKDLLATPMRRLMRLRGVGNKTRLEILAAVKILRETLNVPSEPSTSSQTSADDTAIPPEIGGLSVDRLHEIVNRPGTHDKETARRALNALLDPNDTDPWPGQAEVARLVHVTRARVGQLVTAFGQRWVREPALTRLRADVAALLDGAGGVMTPAEIADALLLTRGSVQDDPERTRRALAVARAAAEAERFIAAPRFQVRRDDRRLFVARDPALADYAARLGDAADRLASEDPLLPPGRALERLRAVPTPNGMEPLPDARLTRLAAAAGHRAALSGRQEFYPRGMAPLRALKLSQGALYGVKCLTVAQIRERVSSRYPQAAPLPPRPTLDSLLCEAGFDLHWDADMRPVGVTERGCYVSRQADRFSLSTGSDSRTYGAAPTSDDNTPDPDARHFEERLHRSLREGSFLALVVDPRRHAAAMQRFQDRFPLEVIELDALIIDALRRTAEAVNARWELVLKADAEPGRRDWSRLMLLVERALPEVEARLMATDKPLLIVYAGMLARYNRMDLLERLRDRSGRRDGPPGVWLLVPGDDEARIDGRAVPLLSPGQRARIPETWLNDRHPVPTLHSGEA